MIKKCEVCHRKFRSLKVVNKYCSRDCYMKDLCRYSGETVKDAIKRIKKTKHENQEKRIKREMHHL